MTVFFTQDIIPATERGIFLENDFGMKEQQLNRLLKLIKKTGDKLVVLEQGSDLVTVMLPLENYERLIDGGNQLDWDEPAEPIAPVTPGPLPIAPAEEPTPSDEPATEEPTPFEIEQALERADEEAAHAQNLAEVSKKKLEFDADWASTNAKPISEEDLSDVPEEEEKFYLEPVE